MPSLGTWLVGGTIGVGIACYSTNCGEHKNLYEQFDTNNSTYGSNYSIPYEGVLSEEPSKIIKITSSKVKDIQYS